jgi:hypothetical protein
LETINDHYETATNKIEAYVNSVIGGIKQFQTSEK